jgi:UDP-glucuronate 4-epimerase
MALFLFTRAILEGRPIQVFNHGKMRRDFTYVDDIIEGVVRIMGSIPEPDPGWTGEAPDPGTSSAPYRIFNIGNNQPVELDRFIETLEAVLGRKAEKQYMDIQPGDVPATFADIEDLENAVGFRPTTPLRTGIERFIDWYQSYYGIGGGDQ